MNDWFERTGIIVFVARYEDCVAFYRDVLALPVEEQQDSLTRFGFGGAYLMVERGGVGGGAAKSRAENPTVLRFNVADIEAAADRLRRQGIAVELRRWDWGVTLHLADPDGNRIELRDRFPATGAPLHSPVKSPI